MRQVIDLNRGWKFIREDAGLPDALPAAWEDVNLPHCWNAIDGMDGNGTYYRGRCWYAKSFDAPRQPLAGGRVYAEVGAAGQQAAIYCNGVKLAYHEGGYSIFRADLTDVLKEDGENLLVIACDNSYLSNVYPQSADFTFYGGLYRGVKLISVPEVHFDLDYYGGPALTVSSAPCEGGGAEFRIETRVTKGAGTSDDFFGRSSDAAAAPEDRTGLCRDTGADGKKDAAADEKTTAGASLADYTVLYSIIDADGREAAGACRPADEAAVKIYVSDAQRAGETTEVKVYSNQSRVMLYLNGKPAGIQSGYRVFRFTVSLEEGQNILVAVAECTGAGQDGRTCGRTGIAAGGAANGSRAAAVCTADGKNAAAGCAAAARNTVPSCVKDSITLEKVEKEPDIYVLPSYRERTEEVANWFTATGTMDLEAPMEFPEGRYNVRDTMYELAKSPEAWPLAARTIKLATNRVIVPDGPMWDFMGPMTFAGMQEEGRFDGMPKGFLASLNAQLTRIERAD